MRRRLTIAIVGCVLGALVVAGLGTLALVRRSAREETRRELAAEAPAAAQAAADLPPVRLRALAQALHLESLAVVRIGPRGERLGEPPPGIDVEQLGLAALRLGETTSGTDGNLAYAAAPIRTRPLTVLILTRHSSTGIRDSLGYFVLAALAALVVAGAVASRLARRIADPLRAAEATTRRIADGDLDARVAGAAGDDEVASLASSINTMATSLQRSRQLERQFLLSVSHDLRTPLTSIRGYAEAIADGAATDTARAADIIASEARRLERLVRDLLDLAKLDALQFSLETREADVAEVVLDTAEAFRRAAEDLGLDLVVDVGGAPDAQALVDPDRLAQVVANLVENALKFATSSIRVALVADADRWLRVTVSDDGPGIGSDELSMVFDRRYTAPRGPGRPVGSGLGLAIVRELVTAMGGTATAASSPAGGATFEVRLPTSRSSASSSMSST